jgi:hypothetical protein
MWAEINVDCFSRDALSTFSSRVSKFSGGKCHEFLRRKVVCQSGMPKLAILHAARSHFERRPNPWAPEFSFTFSYTLCGGPGWCPSSIPGGANILAFGFLSDCFVMFSALSLILLSV